MIWSVGTMVLTLVHHVYGAIIYDEPFRLHVAIVAIPVIIVLLATYAGCRRIPNITWRNVSLIIFLVVTVLFSVLTIGLYEGGYNHLVKNILYFGGTSTQVLDRIYPSVYELPNDLFFELIGVGQLVTGVLCSLAIFKVRPGQWFEILNDPAWRKG